MLKSALFAAGFTLCVNPAQATCHHYATWNYPYPQSCGLAHRAAESKAYYVELVLPTEAATPDQRTPAQIREYAEHNAAMSAYHDELLERLNILLLSEPNQKQK